MSHLPSTQHHMSVNDIDSLIHDFKAYAKQFKKITRRKLSYAEWIEIRSYLTLAKRIIPLVIPVEDIRVISDLYNEIFDSYHATHAHIPMLTRAIWARHIELISEKEFDSINKIWRTAR